jgi:hypothetical protein
MALRKRKGTVTPCGWSVLLKSTKKAKSRKKF